MNRRENIGHRISNPVNLVDNLIDNVISHLQIPQKIYDPPIWTKPDLRPYPVDYLYSGRLSLTLGDSFRDYQIYDRLPNFTFYSAVSYAINSKLMNSINVDTEKKRTYEEFCRLVGVNVIVIGPDPNKYSLVIGRSSLDQMGVDVIPFVLVYHSLDDMYYPIITLERKESNIHYRQSSSILQKLIPE